MNLLDIIGSLIHPTVSPLGSQYPDYKARFAAPTAAPTMASTQAPTPTPFPTIRPGSMMQYVQSVVPPGRTMQQAYPATADPTFMQGVQQANQRRPGLADLLLGQGFFESNLGRTTGNIFGVKPGGGSRQFASPSGALQYQLGPHVLGGGANPNMNILKGTGPITRPEVEKMYASYNPESFYLQQLLDILFSTPSAQRR